LQGVKQLRQTYEPTLKTVLDLQESKLRNTFFCHLVGKIYDFNTSTQTASVEIMSKEIYPDINTGQVRIVDFPLLVDVPVMIVSGSAGSVRVPITKGDDCLVLFSDRDIDNWFDAGVSSVPNTTRTHSLADGLAIIGFRSKASAISDFDNASAQLNYGSTKVKLTDKVLIRNSTNDLKTLLNSLISAIENIATFGSPTNHVLTPASVTALENVKTAIAQVLT
jgi:hypothetical protein